MRGKGEFKRVASITHYVQNIKEERKDENKKVEELPYKRALKTRKLGDSSEKTLCCAVTGKLEQDKLRSNFNLRSQAALHARSVKKERRLHKATKRTEVIKKGEGEERSKKECQ